MYRVEKLFFFKYHHFKMTVLECETEKIRFISEFIGYSQLGALSTKTAICNEGIFSDIVIPVQLWDEENSHKFIFKIVMNELKKYASPKKIRIPKEMKNFVKYIIGDVNRYLVEKAVEQQVPTVSNSSIKLYNNSITVDEVTKLLQKGVLSAGATKKEEENNEQN